MILPALCRLDENPNPLQLAELPDPVPGPGEILVRVVGVRGVPHRAGRDRRPHAPAAAAGRAGAPGCRPGRGGGGERALSPGERVGWRGSIRRADVCVLPVGPGKPLPGVPGDGPRCERRLCRADGRAGAFCLPHPGRLHRRRGRAAVARRHRLSLAAAERLAGWAEPRPDRLRRIGAPGAEDGRASLSHSRSSSSPHRPSRLCRELGAAWAGDTTDPPSRCTASSTRRRSGGPSWRRCGTWRRAAGW